MTKEDAIQELRDMLNGEIDEYGEEGSEYTCEAVEMAIEALQKRKTGKWKYVGKEHTTFFHRRIYRCSVCGDFLDFDGVNGGRGDANYCTHCGAIMVMEGDE